MGKYPEFNWLPEPEEKNYPAAESYLELIYDCKIRSTLDTQSGSNWTVRPVLTGH
jgi:hypothetical protein